ncbi:hypothetical protein L596_001839 [Steinernema carpocapsae]|uniref:Uncharacterized protein n=1 Tax=Steinernema carpocapsae TaxID=34508 RepID=A0A4U8UMN4_STECR|nr:hypothetical protein L596_001839 [Steinernema carpocapsae]
MYYGRWKISVLDDFCGLFLRSTRGISTWTSSASYGILGLTVSHNWMKNKRISSVLMTIALLLHAVSCPADCGAHTTVMIHENNPKTASK